MAAVVLPGGESTTIAKMLHRTGLFGPLKARAQEGSLAVLGTCAGMIAMARGGDEQVARTGTQLLELMDMDVDRNAFGRQRESFEADIAVDAFDAPLHAVFIRAPAARRVFGRAKPLAQLEGRFVFVEQGALLATAFHPELTRDTRVHAMLLERA
jgi:5'-phosphate synthase pdxT subunit